MPSVHYVDERHWLRELRGDRTLRELGEICGLPGGQLSGFEMGRGIPKIATLPALARAYGVDVHYLLDEFLAELEPRTGS